MPDRETIECRHNNSQAGCGELRTGQVRWQKYVRWYQTQADLTIALANGKVPQPNVPMQEQMEGMAILYNVIAGHVDPGKGAKKASAVSDRGELVPDLPVISTGNLAAEPGHGVTAEDFVALEQHCFQWHEGDDYKLSKTRFADFGIDGQAYRTLEQFRQLPGAPRILHDLTSLYPTLLLAYIDLLVQNKSLNSDIMSRMHQDTAPNSKISARLVITVVMVLSDARVGETQVQIAGYEPTAYPAGRGGFCAIHAHAMHRSVPASHDRKIVKVAAFYALRKKE